MRLQPFDLYTIISGNHDLETYMQMKMAWMRISFRVRDLDSAIAYNKRNWKQKVSDEYIRNIKDEIGGKVQDFEKEFNVLWNEKFAKMLKPRKRNDLNRKRTY